MPISDIHSLVSAAIDGRFDQQISFLRELVQLPTDNPPGDCSAHALRSAELLEALGLNVERHPVAAAAVSACGMVSATNLIVRQRIGNGGPTVALNAHGDVVAPGTGWHHPPYGAVVVDDPQHGPTLYGRGAAVSKSDFSTYGFALLALRELTAAGGPLAGRVHLDVELHLTYDEEVGGEIGPRWILDQGLSRPDYAICAGFGHAVTTAHNGCLHLEVSVHGRQGHAAMPESGVDALEATNTVLGMLYRWRRTLNQRTSRTHGIQHPTLNVGLISGGINTNVVPDCVSFRLDRRIIPEESVNQAEAELRDMIAACAASLPGIRVEIRRLLLAQPLVKLAGADRLCALLQRHGAHFVGEPIAEHGVPLYTDARHYAAAGIPTVLYGAGPRSLAEANGHAADECLRLSDLRAATATIAATLIELGSASRN